MTETKIETIDAYIEQFNPEIREHLFKIRALIHATAPEATERMSWQMPTFYFHGNLVHFAVQTKHIGFYPGPEGIAAFAHEFKDYKYSKGAVQFPLNKPIPYDLIQRITAYRYQQNRENDSFAIHSI